MTASETPLSGWLVTDFKWPTEDDHMEIRLKEAAFPTGDDVQDLLSEDPAYLRLQHNKVYLETHGAEAIPILHCSLTGCPTIQTTTCMYCKPTASHELSDRL